MESQSVTKTRAKGKNRKTPAKNKNNKKKKICEGGTCSMFLADLTRKLQLKRMKEEEAEIPKNIIHTIIDTITNALPVSLSRKTIERVDSPPKMESLQHMAPELIPNDTLEVPLPSPPELVVIQEEEAKQGARIPKMPVVSSELMKPKPRVYASMHDIAINTGYEHDVASEIKKHVGTLRKISLIAEEFNQKTAKNLKEIVNSVQEDLIKKLEEIQAEQLKQREREAEEQMQMESIEA